MNRCGRRRSLSPRRAQRNAKVFLGKNLSRRRRHPERPSFFRARFSEKIGRRDLVSMAIPIKRVPRRCSRAEEGARSLTLTRDDGCPRGSDTRNPPGCLPLASKLILLSLHLTLRQITGCGQVLWFVWFKA